MLLIEQRRVKEHKKAEIWGFFLIRCKDEQTKYLSTHTEEGRESIHNFKSRQSAFLIMNSKEVHRISLILICLLTCADLAVII